MLVPNIPPLNFSQLQHQPQHTLQHTSQLQHQLQTPHHSQQQPAVVVAERFVVAEPLVVAELPVPAAGKVSKKVSPIDIGFRSTQEFSKANIQK